MKLLFATTNPHKFEEIDALLADLPLTLLSLSDLPEAVATPEEDGSTLKDNARLKALAYAKASGLACLADDSGLEVDALGGAPGIYSARYAGHKGSRPERDQKNREKLVSELKQLGNATRGARLVCTLCLAQPDGRVEFEGRGACEAQIIDEPRGSFGFGYDSLLYLPELGKTAAELHPAEWNQRSHRAQAAKAFAEWFRNRSS